MFELLAILGVAALFVPVALACLAALIALSAAGAILKGLWGLLWGGVGVVFFIVIALAFGLAGGFPFFFCFF